GRHRDAREGTGGEPEPADLRRATTGAGLLPDAITQLRPRAERRPKGLSPPGLPATGAQPEEDRSLTGEVGCGLSPMAMKSRLLQVALHPCPPSSGDRHA